MERYQGLAGGVSLTCPPPQEKQVRLSDCKLMRTSAGVARAFGEADAQNLEGLMIKDAAGPYVPNDRKVWLKIKKDYLGEAACDAAEVDMADSVDLVVLGAFFGTGQKASLYSSFLMGCFDEEEDAWGLRPIVRMYRASIGESGRAHAANGGPVRRPTFSTHPKPPGGRAKLGLKGIWQI